MWLLIFALDISTKQVNNKFKLFLGQVFEKLIEQ